ncbi:MAG: choice-of-anchor J domain-containing protein [bacterium]|nr:choice-of-anchor J domain-containing protein [bacterium]
MNAPIRTIQVTVIWAMCMHASAAPLVIEGFNGTTTPPGWATEIVNDPGLDPALTYVTNSVNPPSFAPYEGTRFVRFNSYDCPSGAVIRLKYTNGFATVGALGVEVQLAWTEDNEYPNNNDILTIQWSTNGTEWIAITNFYRYNAAGDAWSVKLVTLPASALNLSNVLLGLQFTSRYGNDCHVDDLRVNSVEENVYILPATQTREGFPGAPLAHVVTVTNRTSTALAFDLSYVNPAWNETGPAATPVLNPGGATTFVVNATVPASAPPNAANTAIITAVQGVYSNAATLISKCVWTDTIYNEPFATAASTNGWASYFLAANQLGWFWSTASGNPQPSLRHGDVTVTGIVSNWIVTPAITLPNVDTLTFSVDFITFVTSPRTYYYTGAFISKGSRHPADGDYVEIARASGAPSLLNPVSADISQYRGNTSVYIGFLYVGTNSHRAYVDNVKIGAAVTRVDNAQIDGLPLLALTSYDTTPVLTGWLYRAGETGGTSPAPGYEAQIGYGPRGSSPGAGWVWFDAPYVGAAESNDLYARAIPITMAGSFDLAVRFRYTGGPWVAGDRNGSSNGYSSADAIKLDAAMPAPLGDLIYQQQMGPPASVYFFSYVNPPLTNLTADDFTFGPSNMLVQTVRWTGYRPAPRVGDRTETGFWLRIHANTPQNRPGAVLHAEFHEGYACEFATNVLWHYQAHLRTPFLALAGSTYWLSVYMQCTSVWGVVNSPVPRLGMPLVMSSGNGIWVTNTSNFGMGFELYGIVPEPLGVLVLMSLSLITLRYVFTQ